MFWKKKKEEPAPQVEEKKSGTGMYDCIAVNYLDVIEVDGENLDEVKEDLFKTLKEKKKVYSKADIQKMTDILHYDIWNAFIWAELPELQSTPKLSIKIKYRWLGAKNEFTDKVDIDSKISKHLNNQDFYERTDVQNAAMKVGFDVWGYSDWQTYTETTRTFPNRTILYYTKKH